MKLLLLSVVVALAAANTVHVERLPSILEQSMKDGTWKQKWAEYQLKREIAKVKGESEPQTDIYNVRKHFSVLSVPLSDFLPRQSQHRHSEAELHCCARHRLLGLVGNVDQLERPCAL